MNFLASSVKKPSASEAASMGMAPPAGLAITISYPASLNLLRKNDQTISLNLNTSDKRFRINVDRRGTH